VWRVLYNRILPLPVPLELVYRVDKRVSLHPLHPWSARSPHAGSSIGLGSGANLSSLLSHL
jgi:hypothetical protein